jgi:fatty-acyl-CoA synthase
VLGVPDTRLGAVPFAFVRYLADTSTPTEDDLRAFCAERLANYKVPRYFRAVESFPLTGTGKRELRTLHEMAESQVAATVAESRGESSR